MPKETDDDTKASCQYGIFCLSFRICGAESMTRRRCYNRSTERLDPDHMLGSARRLSSRSRGYASATGGAYGS